MSDSELKPKILIAITHGLYEPWISILKNGQMETWLQKSHSNALEIIHFHATPVGRIGWYFDRLHEKLRWKNRFTSFALRIFDRVSTLFILGYIPKFSESKLLSTNELSIHIKFPDTYQFMRWKDLSILKYFVESSDSDFIFTTTTSSYVLPDKLIEVVKSLPHEKVYAGVKPYEGADFAAGNNRLLSKDVAQLILKNRLLFDSGYIEDLAMGKLIKKLEIKFIRLTSLQIDDEEKLLGITKSELENHFHIRVKSGDLSARNDVLIMKMVHNRLHDFK